MAKQPAPWTTSDLQRRCRELRRALQARLLASETEIADYWPGGSINHEPSSRGKWTYCYANLVRLMGRAEQRDADGLVDAMVAASLANAAQRVVLASGQAMSVLPKSYHALRWLDALDSSLLGVLEKAQSAGEDAADVIRLTVPLLESLAVQLWAWVITTGMGDEPAALPFAEDDAPTPPEWTRTLAPEDLLVLAQAHLAVNGRRLRVIAEAFPSDTTSQSRLSLSGFLGTMAQELGVRPAELMRRWSLGEVFAQAVTRAQAAREAQAAAKDAA